MEISSAEHRQMLRLLTSIYLHDSQMGYVQGMHFFAYILLKIFSEEEAFFVFIRVAHFEID
ncbi:uncharacterized protein [Blastocystis hominis]|uniref:Rab-GAP TBC domain-containing protein n=1 Tax=Blastocystis hominis TaxID=12968 RepID=D8M4F0_BLAHO|nr:uncharacterized protein [Blastocystis hominis]CBK22939.2 unnamed protein product [Blastocystis hominis]|eukprot:XP_012896987.1 uncharacterized protein [Blastocystis hominis]